MENNVQDKWLIVYQGSLLDYKNDALKDNYKNKLVLVTGKKSSTNIDLVKSYLCVSDGTNDVKIPIPSLYFETIKIDGSEYGTKNNILEFAKANGIDISFDINTGAVTIGINEETLTKINSIEDKVDKETYNATVSELVSDIEEKISKTDTIPAENVVNLSYGAKGLASTNPIIANRIPYLKADAFAFLQPEDFTVEVKYNDEVDWVAWDNNNADMRGMFAQLNFGTGFPIDGNNTSWKVGSKIRITLSPKDARNAKVDFVAVNVYANGRTFDILTEYYDSSPSKEGWYSVGDSITISSNGIAFVKYNQYFSFPGYYRKGARFTFTITHNTQYGSKIVGISGYGSLATELTPTSDTAPYTLGTLWYWDYLKNIYFPNDIYEGGTPLKNKYASITSAIQGIESANDDYITISTKGGTDGTTKVIGAKTASINGSENGLATAQDVRAYTKPLKYTVNGVSSTYNGSSEATIPAIYAPNGVGKQGQLLQSMGGGAPQWTNLSAIKEAIGFAKDLTGVLEATPEEFTYRPSARDTSIRDGGAVIRRIKGNTTVWGQYVKNGDFAEGTRYFTDLNSTLSDNGDGSITVTNKLDNSCGLITVFSTHIPRGHRILAIVDYQRDSASSSSTFFYLQRNGGGFDTHITSGIADAQRRIDYAIITSTDDIAGFFFYPFFNSPVGTRSIIYTMAVYDLTAIYDAGNEPTTLEAFREVYPDSYHPYCKPEIRNVKTTAIETVGFNQWDEQWEKGMFDSETGVNKDSNNVRCKNPIKVLPNTVYSVYVGDSRSYVFAMFFDNNGNVLMPIIYSEDSWINEKRLCISSNVRYNTFKTPEGTSWMKFFLHADYGSTYTNDVCISLFHTGIRRGEYEPYKEHILNLPEIAEYFHDGMNGIGDVYDEINSENAVTRIGRVDLGTLDWKELSHKGLYSASISDGKEQKKVNIITHKYPYKGDKLGVADTSFEDKSLFNYYNATNLQNALLIFIKDTTYSDVNAFRAAMSGVDLYYELAEPIITSILEPIQLVYDVEDFGTERAITTTASKLTSAPFRADIVYQFNAEGRIRDNGRNIERLEKSTNILNLNIEGLNGRFDGDFVVAKGLVDYNSNGFLLPEVVGNGRGYNLATEDYVINSIPTEVATATQIRKFEYTTGITPFIPNIMYECSRGLPGNETIPIPLLSEAPDGYDHVWMIRFPAITATNNFSYPFNIRWKDGTAPRFNTACTLELYFKKIDGNVIIGEWKIYR